MTRCGYHTLGLAHAVALGAFGSETPRPPVTSFLSPEITVFPKLTRLSNATYRGIDRLLDQTPLALHLPVVGPKKHRHCFGQGTHTQPQCQKSRLPSRPEVATIKADDCCCGPRIRHIIHNVQHIVSHTMHQSQALQRTMLETRGTDLSPLNPKFPRIFRTLTICGYNSSYRTPSYFVLARPGT
jgi:hypothetical protein